MSPFSGAVGLAEGGSEGSSQREMLMQGLQPEQTDRALLPQV